MRQENLSVKRNYMKLEGNQTIQCLKDQKMNGKEQKTQKNIMIKLGQKLGLQNLAYILSFISSVLYPIGFLYTNQNNFNIFQTSLIRGISVVAINLLIIKTYSINIQYRQPSNFSTLFTRNIIITIQCVVYTLAQFYLTQPIIQTINSTCSIFVFILDYFINGVMITNKQFTGVVFGIVGVLLTVNGELILSYFNYDNQGGHTKFQHYQSSSLIVKLLISLLLLLTQLGWAYSQILTKKLTNVNSTQISFHLGIMIVFFSGLAYPSQVKNPVSLNKFIIAIFASGMIQTISQITFIGATTISKNTGILTMFVFIYVVVGYGISIFRYHQSINPICIIGAFFILFGLAKIVWKN